MSTGTPAAAPIINAMAQEPLPATPVMPTSASSAAVPEPAATATTTTTTTAEAPSPANPTPAAATAEDEAEAEAKADAVGSKDATAATSAATPAPAAPAADADPLAQLFAALPGILASTGHPEMWGVTLEGPTHAPTAVVLRKFLRANAHDVDKASKQLAEALQWRKRTQPLALLGKDFDASKFRGLGFVGVYGGKEQGTKKTTITWNIYGAVKNTEHTFKDKDEFIQWRSAVMELSIQQLKLNEATVPLAASGPDPYQMVQVHDYLNVSFLRADPNIRAASQETIRVFAMAYPELLSDKYFVNVPYLMGWFYALMKPFLSPETVKKFHPLANGRSLADQIGDAGARSELPKAYGGKGADVSEGLTVKYTGDEIATKS